MLTQIDSLTQHKLWKDQLILQVAQATNHLAFIMAKCREEFWSKLSGPDLVELLNSDIPSSLEMMQGNLQLGTMINSWLDALNLPEYSNRAGLTAARTDVVFNGTEFVYVAPVPDPEPTPEPDPEPTPEPTPEPE